MKRIYFTTFLAGSLLLSVGCGPSAEEVEAEKQRIRDSVATADKMRNDSLALVQKAYEDSVAIVQMITDSLTRMQAYEDSVAAAKDKSKPRTKPKPKSEIQTEVPKVGYKKPGAK